MTDDSETVTLTQEMALKSGKAATLNAISKLYFYHERISDISIIEQMPNLEIAYFTSNNLTTLKSFSKLQKLRELYIRYNKLASFDELNYLKDLKNLRVLWMMNNPIAELPAYREITIKLLPQLTKLDDVEISDAERRFVALASPDVKPKVEEPKRLTKANVSQSFPDIDPAAAPQEKPKPPEKLPPLDKVSQPQQPKKPIPSALSPKKKPILASINKTKALPPSSALSTSQNVQTPVQTKEKEDDSNLLSAVLTLLPELSIESLEIVVHKIRELTK